MPLLASTPSLAEVIEAGVAAFAQDIHTLLPAAVVKVDAARQYVDLQPLTRRPYLDENGTRQTELLPVIPNCPVQFPMGAGLVLSFPVKVGDLGMAMFSEVSLDKYLALSGQVVDPLLDHRHHLTDAVFLPGVLPGGKARKTAPDGYIALGTDGGTFQGAALGETLATYLASLKSWLDAHVHGDPVSGVTSVPGDGVTPAPSPSTPTVASSTVKITP